MTLQGMANLAYPEKISIPDFFVATDVKNIDNFCRYAIVTYMKTDKFQNDLEICLKSFEKALSDKSLSSSWFELERDDKTRVFTIKMCFGP